MTDRESWSFFVSFDYSYCFFLSFGLMNFNLSKVFVIKKNKANVDEKKEYRVAMKIL